VVLLDEVEKAHPDVLELFYQVFDKGTLEDGEGRRIDFRNTVLLLTSNVASGTIHRLCERGGAPPELEELRRAVQPELVARFKPALVGRMTVVPYLPLSGEVLRRIVELKVSRIVTRLREQHRTELAVDPAVIENVLARCREAETGARNVDHLLNGSLLPEVSSRILRGLANGRIPARISVGLGANGEYQYEEA
jgi:type VI secretion system protein VasG